ncbi:MAG: hypothetical protein JXR86_02150 [Spirochaetales bacterium]|nr:hypothetical protein [Spirochaetales bacterium]
MNEVSDNNELYLKLKSDLNITKIISYMINFKDDLEDLIAALVLKRLLKQLPRTMFVSEKKNIYENIIKEDLTESLSLCLGYRFAAKESKIPPRYFVLISSRNRIFLDKVQLELENLINKSGITIDLKIEVSGLYCYLSVWEGEPEKVYRELDYYINSYASLYKSIRTLLINSLPANERKKIADKDNMINLHIFYGLTGSGKTTSLLKYIYNREVNDKYLLISYDNHMAGSELRLKTLPEFCNIDSDLKSVKSLLMTDYPKNLYEDIFFDFREESSRTEINKTFDLLSEKFRIRKIAVINCLMLPQVKKEELYWGIVPDEIIITFYDHLDLLEIDKKEEIKKKIKNLSKEIKIWIANGPLIPPDFYLYRRSRRWWETS